MRYAIILASALTGLAIAGPVRRQDSTDDTPFELDIDAVNAAPSPSLTGPPVDVTNQTSVYIQTTAVAAASTQVTEAVTATSTAGNQKRGYYNPATSTSSSTVKQSSTTTTSSTTACPTTPENGTYCGFINPEDACAPQPDGYGPKVQPDTVAAFEAYPAFHQMALSARTPSGYANTFKDLNASVNANSYLGLHTLTSYDTLGCSQWCDNTTLCTGFNIYIERDPSLNPTNGENPDLGWGNVCPNPSSITNYKCTLWGSGVDAAAATNFGQTREQFQVVIAGSNGYEKTNTTTPSCPDGWQPPRNCSGGVISKPSCSLGSKFFPGPFDPKVCASYAVAQTALNKKNARNGQYSPCNSFNSYMIKRDGIPLGTYCSLFTEVVDVSYATYRGGWASSSFWGIESSWAYSLTDYDDGRI